MYSIFLRTNDRYQQYCQGDKVEIGVRRKSGGFIYFPWGGFTENINRPVKLQVSAYSDDTGWDPRRDKMMPRFEELPPDRFLVGNIDNEMVYILLPFRIV